MTRGEFICVHCTGGPTFHCSKCGGCLEPWGSYIRCTECYHQPSTIQTKWGALVVNKDNHAYCKSVAGCEFKFKDRCHADKCDAVAENFREVRE